MNKGGCILINYNNQVGLVYRRVKDDYSFPKGHMEEGETTLECALRETEEETLRDITLVSEELLGTLEYDNYEGHITNYMYLARDNGPTKKDIREEDIEEVVWVDIAEVESKLTYDDLKEFWIKVLPKIKKMLGE